MADPKKAGRRTGRTRKGKPDRGGEASPIPRSMAMTLEYIRLELVDGAPVNLEELDRKFRSPEMLERSGFREDMRVGELAERLGPRISAYENANRDVSFGTQHRYGLVSETRTGVIHIISLFYAFLRCAAADPEKREEQLAGAAGTARKLRALANAAEMMAMTANSPTKNGSNLLETIKKEAWGDAHERLVHEKAVIAPLFDAYRKG